MSSTSQRIEYYPPGPVGAAYLASDAFVCGIRGPVGSGKSVVSVMKLLKIAAKQPPSPVDGRRHARFAVIRNTYPELKTTTVKTFHAWVPPEIGRWRDEGPPTQFIVDDNFDIEILFVALDRPQDVRKLLSLELTAAWINEAREVPKAVLDGLTARVGRYPDLKHGGCIGPQILMDTNPPDTDHWWYRLAEEETPEGWEFFAQPSGLSDQAENDEGLSGMPGGRVGYYTRASQGKDANWVNVYVHGNYGFVLDGKPVYSEFNDQVHVARVDFNPRLEVFVGIDFGLTPAATLMHRTPTGRYLVFDELVTEDMGARRFGELLRTKLVGEYGIQFATGITGDYRTAVAYETRQGLTKAQVIAELEASFAHLHRAINTNTDANLAENINLFGGQMSRLNAMVLTVTHLHEHLGQLIAYARSNGVKPPWSN